MRILRHAVVFLAAQVRATSSLLPLIVVSLLIVVALTSGGAVLAYPAFESPLSPVGSPTPTPGEAPPQPTTEPATPAPTEAPSEPTVEPSQVPPTEAPGEVETPVTEPEPSATTEVPVPEPTRGAADTEGRSFSIGALSWSVLIDACVVGLSSVWLCLGGMALVLFVLGVIASFIMRAE